MQKSHLLQHSFQQAQVSRDELNVARYVCHYREHHIRWSGVPYAMSTTTSISKANSPHPDCCDSVRIRQSHNGAAMCWARTLPILTWKTRLVLMRSYVRHAHPSEAHQEPRNTSELCLLKPFQQYRLISGVLDDWRSRRLPSRSYIFVGYCIFWGFSLEFSETKLVPRGTCMQKIGRGGASAGEGCFSEARWRCWARKQHF